MKRVPTTGPGAKRLRVPATILAKLGLDETATAEQLIAATATALAKPKSRAELADLRQRAQQAEENVTYAAIYPEDVAPPLAGPTADLRSDDEIYAELFPEG